MKRKGRDKTIRQRLFLYFMLLSILISAALAWYYYRSEYDMIWSNLYEKQTQSVSYTIDQIESAAFRVGEFANQICDDAAVRDLLQTGEGVTDEVLDLSDKLDDDFRNLSISSDVLSLYLIGKNGLDLRKGKEASLTDLEEVMTIALGSSPENGPIVYWGSMKENPCRFSRYRNVIPYRRRIIDEMTGDTIGYMILLLRTDIFGDICESSLEYQNVSFALMNSAGESIAASEQWSQVESAAAGIRGTDPLRTKRNGVSYVFFSGISDTNHWKLAVAVPAQAFDMQQRILEHGVLIAIVLAMAISVVLSALFSSQLAAPIHHISEAVEEISAGNFNREFENGGTRELNVLGESIIRMQSDLKAMMDSRVEQEKEKKRVEIQMLRAQINPHFLYNTLNSIKMMAIMQGAGGIRNAVEALGDILHESLMDASEWTTLGDELHLLDQYIYIQNIRYKGNIEYRTEIENPDLLDLSMQRFLLQPLLENSISHGIECGKHRGGTIVLTAKKDGGDVCITVEDDGVGIPEKVLERFARHERPKSRSIGAGNVDLRLRILYGEAYGLKYESVPDHYTRVTMRLKCTVREKNGSNLAGSRAGEQTAGGENGEEVQSSDRG